MQPVPVLHDSSRLLRLPAFAVCLVVLLALPAGSAAASPAAASAARLSPGGCGNVDYAREGFGAGGDPSTPPNPDGPTVVGIGIFVTQLRSIDAVRQQYSFIGHLRAVWCDPRLAFDPNEFGAPEKVYIGEDALRARSDVWLPGGFPANRAGSFSTTERVFRVAPDGTVYNNLNLDVELHAGFDLRGFPFDRQQLQLVIESFRWTADEMKMVPDPSTSGFATDFSLQEWIVEGVSSEASTVESASSGNLHSRFVFSIDVARRPGFYLWKVMLPILIIVALSWSVFWMTDERLPGRSRITATGVLTVVAYQFVIADGLPKIAYLTLLDAMVLISFSLLSITVLQSMLVARYFDRDPARAKQIDRTSRWVFPLVYALMLAGCALVWD